MQEERITYKTCTACKITLPETSEYFCKNKKGRKGLRSQCRICDYIKTTISERKHRERRSKEVIKGTDYNRYLRMIYSQYRLREEDLVELMDLQRGCCAICGSSLVYPNWSKAHLHIDHCHKTLKIRGLLCGKCNWLLGVAEENTAILSSAINYLNKFPFKDLEES